METLAQSMHAFMVLDTYVKLISKNKLAAVLSSVYFSHTGRGNNVVISTVFLTFFFFLERNSILFFNCVANRSNTFQFLSFLVIFSIFTFA